jgi:conjugative transfer signal peptidase TraF
VLAYTAWGIAGLLWGLVQIADSAGIRINHTPSLAPILWRVSPHQGPLQRGDIVSFCPPDNAIIRQARARGYLGPGRCLSDTEPLLKRIKALGGDRVSLDDAGVAVNGVRVAGTSVLRTDGRGQPIAQVGPGTWLIDPDAFWAGSTAHPQSFDSRYFGPVPLSSIIGVAVPLLTRLPRAESLVD